MTEIEITTAAEQRADAEAEPRLTLTQLQSLLRDAAALERAQRPIVIRPSTETDIHALNRDAPVSAQPPARPRHPGIDIDLTVTPSVGWAAIRHRAPSRPGWGLRLAYSGMATTLAGAAGAGVTDGNAGAVAVTAAGLLATLGGIAQAVNEHTKEA